MILILLSRAMPVGLQAVYLSMSSIILLPPSGIFASQRLAYRRANQLSCLAHDGQILARGDDEDTRLRSRHGDIVVRLTGFVSGTVELQTQVAEFLANQLADFRRMLAYTRSEH